MFDDHRCFPWLKITKEGFSEANSYAEQEREDIRSVIYGSIYKATVDPTSTRNGV